MPCFEFSFFFYLDKKLTDQKIGEISKLSVEQAHESTQIIEKYKLFAKMLGTRTRVKEFLLDQSEVKRKELLGIFSEYTKENQNYLAIYLLNTKGIGLISTDERFVGQDYSFRDYFKKALLGESVVDASIGKTSNQFGYYFSYPVRDNDGSVIGVLVVKIDNKEVDTVIFNSEITKDSTIMLVDEYGIILTSNKSEKFLKSLGSISPKNEEKIKQTSRVAGKEIKALQYGDIQKIIDNYEGEKIVRIYDAVDGETEIISITKLSTLPFFLVSEIGMTDIQNLIFSTIAIVIFFVVFGILLLSFLVYRFLISLIYPTINKFESLSQNIGRGDFSKKIELKTGDEFSKLADTFNIMTDRLNFLYSNLDKRIKEKTEELESKSEELENQKNAVLNVLEDIEKEKENAEKLATDLEKFKFALDNASDQIVITDPEGIVVYVNNAVQIITGFSPLETFGKKAGVLWKSPMPKEYYTHMWDIVKNQKKHLLVKYKIKEKMEKYTLPW